jgi:glycerol-3-phosphate dehydrogenase
MSAADSPDLTLGATVDWQFAATVGSRLARPSPPSSDYTRRQAIDELLSPIKEAPGYLKVEALYAVTDEGALHLEDILARRMRISIEYSHRGVDCAREVAEVVAPVLGWSAADIEREVGQYTARVEAEILSQAQPDDVSADELRGSAPEARAEILEPVPLN